MKKTIKDDSSKSFLEYAYTYVPPIFFIGSCIYTGVKAVFLYQKFMQDHSLKINIAHHITHQQKMMIDQQTTTRATYISSLHDAQHSLDTVNKHIRLLQNIMDSGSHLATEDPTNTIMDLSLEITKAFDEQSSHSAVIETLKENLQIFNFDAIRSLNVLQPFYLPEPQFHWEELAIPSIACLFSGVLILALYVGQTSEEISGPLEF